ncbi:conserved hypothetical protein [Ricinus communis]|uniref:Uncharacterized protein n=1 Tax=Ricinus communis TaxID=3988 RepID=B9RNB3_RICCO|nr:conserved hypothetical protein [Ricinus communis]
MAMGAKLRGTNKGTWEECDQIRKDTDGWIKNLVSRRWICRTQITKRKKKNTCECDEKKKIKRPKRSRASMCDAGSDRDTRPCLVG